MSRNASKRVADTKSASAKGVPSASLVLRLCHSVGVLVQEPLRQLHASICSENGHCSDFAAFSGLEPLLEFLDRTLATLQELQGVRQGEEIAGGRALLARLLEGREDLLLCAKSAGHALQRLAVDASVHGIGGRLRVLQESLSETLDGVRVQWRHEDDRRHEKDEISELRSQLLEARARDQGREVALREAQSHANSLIEESAAERRELWQDMEMFARGCVAEHGAIDKERWDNMFSEVGHLSERTDGVRQLSELWASQAAQRDRELRALREHADAAVAERRCAENGAEATRACFLAEQRQLEISREAALRELSEERARRQVIEGLATRSEESEERTASRLTGELAQERRERASLSLQLREAMDTVTSRDNAIESLRRSLTEEVGARVPRAPIAPPVPPLPSSSSNGAGPMPSGFASAPWQASPFTRDALRVPPFPAFSAVHDGTSSVCRVSTDSTAFASHTAANPIAMPVDMRTGTSDAWASPARAFHRAAERHPAISGADHSFNASSLRSVSVESLKAMGTSGTASTAATGASGRVPVPASGSASDHTGVAARPWELPPEDFLALWRRSRTAVLPGGGASGATTPLRNSSNGHDMAVPQSAETLRITASFH